MLFGREWRQQGAFDLNFCGSILQKVSAVKYLELHLDDLLSFEHHVNVVYQKIGRVCGLMLQSEWGFERLLFSDEVRLQRMLDLQY